MSAKINLDVQIGFVLRHIRDPLSIFAIKDAPLPPIPIFDSASQAKEWKEEHIEPGGENFEPAPVNFSGVYGAAYYGQHVFLMRSKVAELYNSVASIPEVKLKLDCCFPLPIQMATEEGWNLMAVRRPGLPKEVLDKFALDYKLTVEFLSDLFGHNCNGTFYHAASNPSNN